MKINLSINQQQQKKDVKTKRGDKARVGVKEQEQIGIDLWKQIKRISKPTFDGKNQHMRVESSIHSLHWPSTCNTWIQAATAETTSERRSTEMYWEFGAFSRNLWSYEENLVDYEKVGIVYWVAGGFQINTIWQCQRFEQFSDLLDVASINFRESRQYHELGTGSLHVKLRLPEMMLASYHRWIFENNQLESVEKLRDWIVQEAEFQTTAADTIKGIMNQKKKEA